ncbi:ArnT family glycosyltransferase [Azospira inquinata]|uniref:Glycosyltransferase RgtA/B/C/D-like domain-containing protein n=1 Tax=Azospira inquinata TaxID=2785627 RepID=A0A975XU85_9RHOO|nr:hypothetical protein [Azospira inquinata]QWT46157.1 hypothetical protein J8L76_00140 [Azospira inquinata]QWT48514.1 hypothetical protein Azoinq_11725 [Azospira inquinata]
MTSSPRKELTLPLAGWPLGLLLAVFLLPGLIGHDPWKLEDAAHFGVVWNLLREGNWLTPHLADSPWREAPLYYGVAALCAKATTWLLLPPDGARLASALFGLLALGALGGAGRELYGRDEQRAAPLMLAGTLGLLVHIHQVQPGIAFLAGQSLALWGLCLLLRRPLGGGLVFAGGLGLALLSVGIAPSLALLPPLLLAPWFAREARLAALGALLGLILGLAIGGLWPLTLYYQAPDHLAYWWSGEWRQIGRFAALAKHFGELGAMLPWYGWPALPLALWSLWTLRREWSRPALLLPLLAFLAAWLVQAATEVPSSASALPLLPPLALLATAGVTRLRRGAANALDWFGIMTFTFAAGLIWLGWVAMVFQVPKQIAFNFAKLEPGFMAQFSWLQAGVALVATIGWLIFLRATPRSPFRGLTRWTAGLSLFWLLTMVLWTPWIDYGKSYRPVAEALSSQLPPNHGCVAARGLGEAQRASLDYFSGIITRRANSSAGKQCRWLITLGQPRDDRSPGEGWQPVWEGSRPGDRSEKLRLYKR